MRVSGLDKNDDWRFGRGLAAYILDSKAIAQNVVTRLRSFQFDWYLDESAEIDWINLLGQKNNQSEIEQEIERVVLGTDGVVSILDLRIITNNGTMQTRKLSLELRYTDIFNAEQFAQVEVEI